VEARASAVFFHHHPLNILHDHRRSSDVGVGIASASFLIIYGFGFPIPFPTVIDLSIQPFRKVWFVIDDAGLTQSIYHRIIYFNMGHVACVTESAVI